MQVTAKGLQKAFRDLSAAQAEALVKQIHEAHNPQDVDSAMLAVNDATFSGGIEAIRGDYHVDSFYGEIVALYVNVGDPYIATVLYETETETFHLTGYGDWVQDNDKRYRII